MFVSDASGNPDIYLQRVGGRNPINLTTDSPAADTAPSFSPDGERIAFCSERDGEGIYVMGSTGESVKRLTDFGHDPSWSPDGKQIVFSTGSGQDPWSRDALAQLWVVPSSGLGEIGRSRSRATRCSRGGLRTGERIAFWGLKERQRPAGHLDDRRRRDGRAGAGRGHERPDHGLGSRLVARRPQPLLRERARRLDEPVARGDRRGVRPHPRRAGARDDTLPHQRLDQPLARRAPADVRELRPALQHPEVRLRPRGGQGGRAAAAGLPGLPRHLHAGASRRTASGSPSAPSAGQEDLFVVQSDGTGYRQITDDAFRDRGPKWSPDGTRIAFYSDRSGRYETWTIRPDGSGLEQLTKTTGPSRSDSEWSPDGKRIATTDGVRTWIEDLTQPLGQRPAEPLPPLEGGHALQPRSWSPDGSTLAGDLGFDISPSSVTLLYSFARKTYTALPEGRGTPAWLRDSRRLLVARHDRIVLLDTRTGRATTVLPALAQGLSLSADDRWVTLHRAPLRGRRLDGDAAALNLIANVDRHLNNAMASPGDRLMLIDHSRSFRDSEPLRNDPNAKVTGTNARLWGLESDAKLERFPTRHFSIYSLRGHHYNPIRESCRTQGGVS